MLEVNYIDHTAINQSAWSVSRNRNHCNAKQMGSTSPLVLRSAENTKYIIRTLVKEAFDLR